MTKARIGKICLALIVAGAVGYYLEHGPRFPNTKAEEETLRLLREPRPLPNIAFTDAEGRSIHLSTYRGRVILLNIWATWCPPCRKEMPALDRLQNILGGPNFEVIALSVDDGDALPRIKAFYQQVGIKRLEIYLDKSKEVMFRLGVAAIPTTLLIDRHGREIGRKRGPMKWDNPALIKQIRDYLDVPLNVSEVGDMTLPSSSQRR